jgi:aminodeoxyfutalosine deaminase
MLTKRPQDDVDRLARVAISQSFLAGLPKVELHVHHVGSVPLRAVAELVANGVTVTINTDHPPMVGTDLNTDYAMGARLLDLDEQGVTELALAAVDASFASRETKDALRSEINSYAAMPAP